MYSDNPAARLLAILKEGRSFSANSPCKHIWNQLLNIENDDMALLMSRLGKLMELPNQIIQDIQDNYPNQSSTYRHWSTKVNNAFMEQNLNGLWRDFIKNIDEHTIDYLQMTADLLDNKAKTRLISASDASAIRDNVDALLRETIENDLDEDFKKYIVHYLRKIIIAIDEYNISGAIPIAESIESVLGHAFLDNDYLKNISNTDFGKKILTVLNAVASVVTIAVGLPQLPELFNHLLINSKGSMGSE